MKCVKKIEFSKTLCSVPTGRSYRAAQKETPGNRTSDFNTVQRRGRWFVKLYRHQKWRLGVLRNQLIKNAINGMEAQDIANKAESQISNNVLKNPMYNILGQLKRYYTIWTSYHEVKLPTWLLITRGLENYLAQCSIRVEACLGRLLFSFMTMHVHTMRLRPNKSLRLSLGAVWPPPPTVPI